MIKDKRCLKLDMRSKSHAGKRKTGSKKQGGQAIVRHFPFWKYIAGIIAFYVFIISNT